MPKQHHENYFEKPKEVPIHKDPFSLGKENESEDPSFGEGEFSATPGRKGLNPAPMIRIHKKDVGPLPPEVSDLHEKEKKEELTKLEKEFELRLEEIKKADKTFESDKQEGDSGSYYSISKNDQVICSVTLAKDRILVKSKKTGPKTDKFFSSQKEQFFKKFEEICSQ